MHSAHLPTAQHSTFQAPAVLYLELSPASNTLFTETNSLCTSEQKHISKHTLHI